MHKSLSMILDRCTTITEIKAWNTPSPEKMASSPSPVLPPTHRRSLFLSPEVSFSCSWTSGEGSCTLHWKGSYVWLVLHFLCVAGASPAPLCWVALHCMTVSQFASCSHGCTLNLFLLGVWMKLLWAVLYMTFCGHRLSFSSGEYWRMANNKMLNIISH